MTSVKKVKNEMPAGAALSRYDAADYLQTPEARAAYLETVFEEYGDDARVVAKALGDVARAQGMQKIAKETGLNREGLYQALSGAGNPSFDTILKVMRAVGVELRPRPTETLRAKRASRKRVSARGEDRTVNRRSDAGARGSQGRKRA